MPKQNINIILLCAGKSSRMGLNVPKVILKINGKSILSRTLETIQKVNPQKIIIVVGYKKKMVINEAMKLGYKNLHFVTQNNQNGTGHAVKIASKKISTNSTSIVLNGDTPFISHEIINNSLKTFIRNSADLLLATSSLDDPTDYGRIIRQKNKIIKIIEEKNCSKEEKKINEINCGLYIFKSKNLITKIKTLKKNIKKEYYLTDMVEIYSNDRKKIVSYNVIDKERFLNINNTEELYKAHEIDRKYFYYECLKKDITLTDPSTIHISPSVKLSKNIKVGSNVIIEGQSSIESNVEIVGNVYIKDSVIKSNSIIKPFVNIINSKIGTNSQIGPFSNLRPSTVLKSNTKIGNFVEIKKSTIGNNSKVPHLSYIGDTEMGSNVNVGAGSITCNYDGFEKHKTVIKDNVFLGSDTKLVAPIIIGKESTTGAGTVLSKDLPDGSLGITRVKEKHLPNWKRKPKKK